MTVRKTYTFLALFGLSIIILGIVVGAKDIAFIFNSNNAKGEIISLSSTNTREIRDAKTIYIAHNYAVVSFTTNSGKVIEFDENVSILYFLFTEGQNIEVIYDINNPNNAHLKTYYPFLVFPGLLAAFGLFWILCLVPSYLFAKSKGVSD